MNSNNRLSTKKGRILEGYACPYCGEKIYIVMRPLWKRGKLLKVKKMEQSVEVKSGKEREG